MNGISMADLIRRTLNNEEEFDALRFAGISAFLAAVARLEKEGITQSQLQMLLGCPFSRFSERECFETQVMALAIERGTATAAGWHEVLRNQAMWARMHNGDFAVPRQTLPDPHDIDAALGLPSRQPDTAHTGFACAAGDRKLLH